MSNSLVFASVGPRFRWRDFTKETPRYLTKNGGASSVQDTSCEHVGRRGTLGSRVCGQMLLFDERAGIELTKVIVAFRSELDIRMTEKSQ